MNRNSSNQEILPFNIDYGNKVLWEDETNKRAGTSAATKHNP